MKLTPSFLRVRMDVPLHVHALAFGYDGIGIGRRRRLAGRADHHTGAVDGEAAALPAFQLVPQGNLYPVPLVSTDDVGLHIIALYSIRRGSRAVLVLYGP